MRWEEKSLCSSSTGTRVFEGGITVITLTITHNKTYKDGHGSDPGRPTLLTTLRIMYYSHCSHQG